MVHMAQQQLLGEAPTKQALLFLGSPAGSSSSTMPQHRKVGSCPVLEAVLEAVAFWGSW